jgi:hypothetical protein
MQQVLPFHDELTTLLNKYSWDNFCGVPDYILADHLEACMVSLKTTVEAREKWFGRPELTPQVREVVPFKPRNPNVEPPDSPA